MSLDSEIKALEDEKQKQTDEFFTSENIIELLGDVLDRQEKQGDQTTYVTPAAQPKPKNYTIYIIGAAVFYFLFVKKGRI